MNEILKSLLEAIQKAKVENPQLSVYPKMIGAVISLEYYGSRQLNEWISLLEDRNTPMNEIMAVATLWDDSSTESIAYYVEITDQLKEGLYISIDAMGY